MIARDRHRMDAGRAASLHRRARASSRGGSSMPARPENTEPHVPEDRNRRRRADACHQPPGEPEHPQRSAGHVVGRGDNASRRAAVSGTIARRLSAVHCGRIASGALAKVAAGHRHAGPRPTSACVRSRTGFRDDPFVRAILFDAGLEGGDDERPPSDSRRPASQRRRRSGCTAALLQTAAIVSSCRRSASPCGSTGCSPSWPTRKSPRGA